MWCSRMPRGYHILSARLCAGGGFGGMMRQIVHMHRFLCVGCPDEGDGGDRAGDKMHGQDMPAKVRGVQVTGLQAR